MVLGGFLLLGTQMLAGATFYVRTDGGTAEQCNGSADAPYPGTGTGLACAWSHPFVALDADGRWRISGGDTLVIGRGDYRMGYGAPNSGWCEVDFPWDCRLPPLPSGASAGAPTRMVGAGWNTRCSSPPELWGTERAYSVVSLENSSNVVLACLEITDHSSCAEFHVNGSVACQRDMYPYGDWAQTGITAMDSENVTLEDLDVHGLAFHGIQAARLVDWTVRNVRLAGNGWVGWEGDIDGNDSNSGTLRFEHWTVEWNGCPETWPGQVPDNCWEQESGGYGDGVGTGATGGHWIIEDSVFRNNTSDGLDLLYVGRDGSATQVDLRRTVGENNLGTPIKIGGPSTFENVLARSNCGFFDQKPFAQDVADYCRAGANALVIRLRQGDTSTVANSTVVGEGDVLVEVECDTEFSTCDGSETVTLRNNIFMGFAQFEPGGGDDWTNFMWDPMGVLEGRMDSNVVYDVRSQDECPFGTNEICSDPLFVNADIDNFDGRLRAGSPALNSGLATGGLIPADALEGNQRPFGAGVDRGAYERADGPVPRLTVDAAAPVTAGQPVSVDLGMTALSHAGIGADWWLVVSTPSGWLHYDAFSGQWASGIAPGFQGPLFDLAPVSVGFMPALAGGYQFFFGVDMNENGLLNLEQAHYRTVSLSVAP
jgi:hypothetical protein